MRLLKPFAFMTSDRSYITTELIFQIKAVVDEDTSVVEALTPFDRTFILRRTRWVLMFAHGTILVLTSALVLFIFQVDALGAILCDRLFA